MIYSEAAYFDGNHCAHCAARDEYNRLERKRADGRKAWDARQRQRRTGGRAGMTGRRLHDNPAPALRAI